MQQLVLVDGLKFRITNTTASSYPESCMMPEKHRSYNCQAIPMAKTTGKSMYPM
jgi:hypothetical protein